MCSQETFICICICVFLYFCVKLHADASAVESGLASVTRTDIGGHFCGIQLWSASTQISEQLSRCLSE